jgi:hypothetical protein
MKRTSVYFSGYWFIACLFLQPLNFAKFKKKTNVSNGRQCLKIYFVLAIRPRKKIGILIYFGFAGW